MFVNSFSLDTINRNRDTNLSRFVIGTFPEEYFRMRLEFSVATKQMGI